eukprot:8409697-Lingulodinium_polyedra.AAC.1
MARMCAWSQSGGGHFLAVPGSDRGGKAGLPRPVCFGPRADPSVPGFCWRRRSPTPRWRQAPGQEG